MRLIWRISTYTEERSTNKVSGSTIEPWQCHKLLACFGSQIHYSGQTSAHCATYIQISSPTYMVQSSWNALSELTLPLESAPKLAQNPQIQNRHKDLFRLLNPLFSGQTYVGASGDIYNSDSGQISGDNNVTGGQTTSCANETRTEWRRKAVSI